MSDGVSRGFTLHVDGRAHELELADGAEGELWLPVAAIRELTGWKLDRRGLCRDGACVPRSLIGGVRDDAIELSALARAIGARLRVEPDGASATLLSRGS